MKVTDDDLRRLATPGGTRAACPSPEDLAEATAGGLEDGRRQAVLAHVAGCADCAQEGRLVAPLHEWSAAAAAEARGAAAKPARPLWSRWPVWAAAAALLLVALPLVPWRRGPEPVITRTQSQPQIRPLLPESAPLSRQNALLRWSDLGAGVRYSVTILTKDLSPLASAERLERPEYAVPADALARVPAGGEIVWSVEARWPDGRRLVSSTFVHRLD
jgi:hypothetical protein